MVNTPEQIARAKALEEKRANNGVAGLDDAQQKRLEQVKTSPQYQTLLDKGYTEEQIVNAVGQYKPKNTTETQVQPQPEIKPATQEIKAEPIQAKIEETPKTDIEKPVLLPQSDYLDDSEARQQGIIANLNNSIQTNPQSLKDSKSFKEYYNYVGRSDIQKKTLDTWYKGYEKGQELSYKNTNDIYKAYDSGNLSSGDLSNLKIVNPAKYEEVNALIDKKNKLMTYQNDLYGPTETVNPFQTIIDNYTKGLQTLATSNFYNDYKEAMNSAGIKEQKLAISDKQSELDKIDKQINEKKSEIEKRYEGTGATRGKINAIVADETEDLYSMRSNLAIDMNTAISKYNAEAGSIKEDFEMKQAEQQYNMQVKQQQMSELGFAMQLMSYETPAQQDERAWNNFIRQQEYTDGNIYSSDPKTRLRAIEKAVDNTLKEFEGIPMVRSRDQMVNDIKNMVEQGADLGDAITENIREPIKTKPEYKLWSAKKLGVSDSGLETAGMTFKRNDETKSRDVGGGSTTSGVLPGELSSLSGADLTAALASGTYNGNKFFGVYATGDPTGKNRAGIYSTIEKEGLENYYNRVAKGAPVTLEMIQNASNETGIAPEIIATFLQADSNFGKSGLGSKNNNPGNVGQFDRYGTNAVKGYATMQEGVTAAAKNLQSRMNALGGLSGGTTGNEPTAAELLYFGKGTIKKNAKDEGLTQARYNEIAKRKESQGGVKAEYSAEQMQSIELPVKATEFTKKSFSYGNRLSLSNEKIKDYEDIFVERGITGQLYQTNTKEALKSDNQKSYESYKENFITANLRQESGAAIAPTEFEKEEKKYFAQPGDSKEVVEQKRVMRELAIKNMYAQAGSDVNGVPISNYYKPSTTQTQKTTTDINYNINNSQVNAGSINNIVSGFYNY